MTSVERYYARFGFTRRPPRLGGEGLFQFRWRAEFCTGLRIIDEIPLRERLYVLWIQRHHRPRPGILPSKIMQRRELLHQTEARLRAVFKDWIPL